MGAVSCCVPRVPWRHRDAGQARNRASLTAGCGSAGPRLPVRPPGAGVASTARARRTGRRPGLDTDLERPPVAPGPDRVPTALQHSATTPQPGPAAATPGPTTEAGRARHGRVAGAPG